MPDVLNELHRLKLKRLGSSFTENNESTRSELRKLVKDMVDSFGLDIEYTVMCSATNNPPEIVDSGKIACHVIVSVRQNVEWYEINELPCEVNTRF